MKDFADQNSLDQGLTRVTLPEEQLPELHPATQRDAKYVTHWDYRDGNNNIVGYVYRYDESDKKKKIIPYTPWKDSESNILWLMKGFGENRPLYNLPQILAADADTRIVIGEGEKTADAISEMLPRAVATTWSGGANAIAKTDFTSLAGKNVTVSADCDPAGEEALKTLVQVLLEVGVLSLRIIDTAKLAVLSVKTGLEVPDKAVTKGYDLADALAEGWHLLFSVKPLKPIRASLKMST